MKLGKSQKNLSVKNTILNVAPCLWAIVTLFICKLLEICGLLDLENIGMFGTLYMIILLEPFLIMGLIRYMKMAYNPSVLGIIFKAMGIVVFIHFVVGCVIGVGALGVSVLTDGFSLIGCIVIIIMLALFYGISMGLFVLAVYFENKKRQAYDPNDLENLLKK